jgi:hypothetical protein
VGGAVHGDDIEHSRRLGESGLVNERRCVAPLAGMLSRANRERRGQERACSI